MDQSCKVTIRDGHALEDCSVTCCGRNTHKAGVESEVSDGWFVRTADLYAKCSECPVPAYFVEKLLLI